MTAAAKILVIEDEPDMLTILRDNLELEGYRVDMAKTGEDGLKLALRDSPDVILLDIMLPGMSGYDVCRNLRSRGVKTPVILITARNSEMDRVAGLDLGADDYVGKPFNIGEVLARVRVQIRHGRDQEPQRRDEFRFGNVVVDVRRQVVKRAGKRVEMTSREFQLLSYFILHQGELVTRDQLLIDVWGYSHPPLTRAVDNFVFKLRSKLEVDPQRPRYFLTAYGTGYRFTV
ncbi:MAG TPA: response regulator transcription factor [Vicinamibacterales bacterium]|jgi:two-component system alkaline phosphatase synthesis response regulator PhoP|nr:response regulator transcription factor [Vicinamibacterales bacterium]